MSTDQVSGRLRWAVCLHVEAGDLGIPSPFFVYPPLKDPGLLGGGVGGDQAASSW